MIIHCKVKRLTDTAKIPTRGTPCSAGYDVYADIKEPISLKCQETYPIPTGLCFEPAPGYHIKVESRSGTAVKNSIGVLCGVIDQDYRGELKIVLFNNSDKEEFQILPGQKIAQLVFVKTVEIAFDMVDTLSDSSRGEGGFGSTGK